MEFDVLVIAMQRETERRHAITDSLAAAGVDDFHFLDATDGKDAQQLRTVTGYDPVRACELRGRELVASEIACFESHRRSWAWIASRSRPVLVLESDAQVSRDMMTVCHELCVRKGENLPDWQHVMLYYHECLPSLWGRFRVVDNYQLVRFANRRVYISSSMLITQEAARRFLQMGQDIYLPVDDFMTGGFINKGVELFGVYPPPASLSQMAQQSNIQDERAALESAEGNKSSLRRYSLWLRQLWRQLRRPQSWR